MLDDDTAAARAARHLFRRAYQLQQRGSLADAIRLYKESLAHYPTAEAYTFLGWVYGLLRRYPEAIDACHQAINLDPTFGNPYNDIGVYLIELDQWRAAVPWLEKGLAAARYENREFAHFNLGRVYEHLGPWARAVECYQAALELNPRYERARLARRLLIGKMS